MTNKEIIKIIYDKYPILKNLSNNALSKLLIQCAMVEDIEFGKACGELLKFTEDQRILFADA